MTSVISKKNLLLAAIMFIVAGGLGFTAVSALSSQSSQSYKTVCEAGVTCVDLSQTGATPSTVTLKVGESVQFNAKSDATYHLERSGGDHGSLHADHGSEPVEHISSGDFSGNQAWKVVFKEAGTYQFQDEFNPEIEVLVVVYQEGGDFRIR